MVIALPALAEILFWTGALIFCILCVYIAKALFGVTGGVLGKLPVVGGWINSSLHSIEHKIVAVMSGAAASVDAHIGAAFHRLARVIDWMGREIRSHANLIALLASLLLGASTTQLVRLLWNELRRAIHAAQATGAHVIKRTFIIEKRIARGIGEDVLPRIRTAEREIGRVIHRDIPGIRAREKALAGEVTALGKWVRHHTLVAGSLAFAGAVALALSRLGLGWARCSNVGKVGRRICGMDASLLDALLLDALVIAGPISIVELAKECQDFTRACEDGLRFFVRELS